MERPVQSCKFNTKTVEENKALVAGDPFEAIIKKKVRFADVVSLHPFQPFEYNIGMNAWNHWVDVKNLEMNRFSRYGFYEANMLKMSAEELNFQLCLFVREVRNLYNTAFPPDCLYYFCLGIQHYLSICGREDKIFSDKEYARFTDVFDEIACRHVNGWSPYPQVEEEYLWECNVFGADDPMALLETLVYLNTKNLKFRTVEQHLEFSNKQLLRLILHGETKLQFFPPNIRVADTNGMKLHQHVENHENPLTCPVKLYDFYMSKCQENVRSSREGFYFRPSATFTPYTTWFTDVPLDRQIIEKMLNRIKMIKGIFD